MVQPLDPMNIPKAHWPFVEVERAVLVVVETKEDTDVDVDVDADVDVVLG